jgi:hypothetical protein
MTASADLAFELKTVLLPITSIATRIDVTQEIRKSSKYKQIAASIEHVGLIEPLIVSAQSDGSFLLLDGALRFDIFKERKNTEVLCIVSTDDEGYTYNKRVNHLSNISEHYMILKALSNGVSEQMISASLNVDVATIRRKRSLLDGICAEAIQLLTNRRVFTQTYGVLRKMKPLGQIQAAERMVHANNYSSKMAKTLLTITKPDLMVRPAKANRSSPGSVAKLTLLQAESDTLLIDVKQVEENYATQALDLTLSIGYIGHLLENTSIVKYLTKQHPDILSEFQKMLAEKADERSRPMPESIPPSRRRKVSPKKDLPDQKASGL